MDTSLSVVIKWIVDYNPGERQSGRDQQPIPNLHTVDDDDWCLSVSVCPALYPIVRCCPSLVICREEPYYSKLRLLITDIWGYSPSSVEHLQFSIHLVGPPNVNLPELYRELSIPHSWKLCQLVHSSDLSLGSDLLTYMVQNRERTGHRTWS